MGFDEPAFTRAAGGTWISLTPGAYETFNGCHNNFYSAVKLSRALAAKIKGSTEEL